MTENGKTLYVMGLAFNAARDLVLLVHKRRPAFLAGKWNGLGGHVEEGETLHEAMVREFHEETGLRTAWYDWTQFARLETPRSVVYCFAAHGVDVTAANPENVSKDPADHGDAGPEPLFTFLPDVGFRATPVKENLLWMVPLARDVEQLGAPLDVLLTTE